MKISQLCQMIQNSLRDGKYPLEEQHRHFSNSLQVINRSDSEDMQSNEIKIEVRIHGLYILSNVPRVKMIIFDCELYWTDLPSKSFLLI